MKMIGPNNMAGRVSKAILFVLLLLTGCVSTIPVAISSPFKSASCDQEVRTHAEEIVRTVEERNKTIESTSEWLGEAYEEFMIKKLSDIGESEYEEYAKYLDDGMVYIIVHPAYYTFFFDDSWSPDVSPGMTSENALNRLLSTGSYSSKSLLIKSQEKQLRDFMEFMSTDKKLVILVLPKDYEKFPAYKFRKGRDEYKRFINEVTNESESVFYLYSKRPNRGSLFEKDKKRLMKFLYAVKAKGVLLGGGFAGRCLDDFYTELEQHFSEDKIFLVPEITSLSPADMSNSKASDMLNDDGTVNIDRLSNNIMLSAKGNRDMRPKIKTLQSWCQKP